MGSTDRRSHALDKDQNGGPDAADTAAQAAALSHPLQQQHLLVGKVVPIPRALPRVASLCLPVSSLGVSLCHVTSRVSARLERAVSKLQQHNRVSVPGT